MTVSLQIPCRSVLTTVAFDHRLRCWQYCYITITCKEHLVVPSPSHEVSYWARKISWQTDSEIRVVTFLLFFYIPFWDEEWSLPNCLICYLHVSVYRIPIQHGEKHKNILPLISPVPSDIADEGTLSNTGISILLLLLMNVRSILLDSIISVECRLTKDAWFDCQQGQEIILCPKCTDQLWGHTQPPIQ